MIATDTFEVLPARNASEFCSGSFTHNGRFIFVNMLSPGLTLVIEG